MKAKIGIVLLFFIVVGATYLFLNSNQQGVDQTYLLPNGFEGCVVINYDVKDAKPLQIENNEIIYKVPKDGIINTSSPMEFGWVNKKHSGSFQLKAFYVDESGKKIKELPQDKILLGANGSAQEDGKPKKDYFYQIFGSKEIENQGCPAIER
ncbi:DUF6843 domain-containing protein [Bacillus sp. CGMCC 1.60114]|uniref:DUF6843 domain-containing protein n=1 Tax=unclassified Bacillus (in: firmicutes) TaxID=185979 RepID=UPI00363523E4